MARRPSAGLAAVAAQFSQAIGSFLLQALASRALGAEGLGAYALVFGMIVVATSITSGLVGDSLTVLDRADPRTRAGLQTWLAGVAAVSGVTFALVAWGSGWLTGGQALLVGIACWAFVIEDTMRRLLMASMRFWSLVLVDVTALVVSVGFVVSSRAIVGDVTLTTFFAALALGQVAAIGMAVVVLPPSERWLARGVHRHLAAVWRYGAWRALQQLLRPTMLTAVRVVVTGALGLAVYGELEAARLYVAPAMLMVSGAASYLFASYAHDRAGPMSQLRRRADRAVSALILLTLSAGAVATGLAPQLGGLIIADDERLSQLAVLGWAAYAAATAAVTPYGSLAAVRGRQVAVLAVRAGDSAVSIIVVVLMLAAGASAMTLPFALAGVTVLSGVVMRIGLLRSRMPTESQAAVGVSS